MAQLERQRIRLSADTATFDQMLDVRTEEAPVLWRGNDVQFEIGLFRGTTLLDVANFASMSVEVKENSATGLADTPLMTATITETIDNTLEQASWDDETKQHGLFAFTGDETNLDLGTGNTEKTYWLVLSGLTNDTEARRVTFGHTLLKIREDGSGVAGTPPTNDPLYYTQAETETRLGFKLDKANNLSDIADAPTARTNLDAAASSSIGQANGLCPLDANATVPTANLPATILGAMQFQGTWDAAANSPDLGASTPEQGDYHVVNVAGATSLEGITDWQVGDWVVYDGTAWSKIDNSDRVSSVNGKTGAITLTMEEASDWNSAPLTNGQLPVWDEDAGQWNARSLTGDVSLDKLGATAVQSLTPGALSLAGFDRVVTGTDIALTATSPRLQHVVPNAIDINAALPQLSSINDGWACEIIHDGASHVLTIQSHANDGGANLAWLHYADRSRATRVNGAWQIEIAVPTKAITLTANAALEGENLVRVDATAGAITVTLPPSQRWPGQRLHLWKTDASANTVTAAVDAGDTLVNSSAISSQWSRAELTAFEDNTIIQN